MRAPRDILKHVNVEVAKARRKCRRDQNHTIRKGECCLVIKEGSFGGSRNYCCLCALPILAAAEVKQAVLRRQIGSATE
jgi:hypothetical protein